MGDGVNTTLLYSWSGDYMQNLHDLLANLFDNPTDPKQFSEFADLPTGEIVFQLSMRSQWFNVLDMARKVNKVSDIIDQAIKDPRGKNNLALKAAKEKKLKEFRGPEFDTHPIPSDEHLEKISGRQSTMLPISFLQQGLNYSNAVARVVLMDGSSGTGFLIDDNRFITNHHVLETAKIATSARIYFNYQENIKGLALPYEAVELLPNELFKTSKKWDWTAVKVKGDMNTKYGAIPFVKIDKNPDIDSFTMIIQHPMGEPKKIAMFRNLITYADNNIIQYVTDTQKGSSGSPVFNDKWELIALHHAGYEEDYDTKLRFATNEGIHINRVIEGVNS